MGDADCPHRNYSSQGGEGGSLRRGQGAAAGELGQKKEGERRTRGKAGSWERLWQF